MDNSKEQPPSDTRPTISETSARCLASTLYEATVLDDWIPCEDCGQLVYRTTLCEECLRERQRYEMGVEL